MKLKSGGKIILFLLLGVIAFFLVRKYLLTDETDNTMEVFDDSVKTANKNSRDLASNTKVSEASSKTESPSKSGSTSNPGGRTFNYTPDKPENGKLKGVVEMGAAGFNSFIINMDQQKRWQLVAKDFGESLAYEGLATTADIRAGLKKYLTDMFDKGLNKKDMHFVVSAGAQKEPKTIAISDELKTFGYVVNLVTTDKEGKFAFKATVPPAFQDSSFLLDIGSGTTKITWKQGTDLKSLELPGSKYFEKGISNKDIYTQVKSKAEGVPQGKRKLCFILGGVPFTLAKQNRKGEERFTILNTADTYKGKDKKTEAGLNIYKAVADATNCNTFVFDWDSNFTIGFLLSLK